MSRYIETDTLKEQMLKYGFHSEDQTVTEFVEDTLQTAEVVPMEFHERCIEFEIKKQANMVEVVRCKECKFWQSDWETSYDGYHYCSMIDVVIDGDFYCKDGERKILPKD